jgi:hypothetical protein
LRLSGTPETSGGLRGAHSYKHTDRAVKTKKRDKYMKCHTIDATRRKHNSCV